MGDLDNPKSNKSKQITAPHLALVLLLHSSCFLVVVFPLLFSLRYLFLDVLFLTRTIVAVTSALGFHRVAGDVRPLLFVAFYRVKLAVLLPDSLVPRDPFFDLFSHRFLGDWIVESAAVTPRFFASAEEA